MAAASSTLASTQRLYVEVVASDLALLHGAAVDELGGTVVGVVMA